MKLHLAQVGPARALTAGIKAAPESVRPPGLRAIPVGTHCSLKAAAGPAPGSPEFRGRMASVRDALRAEGVGAVVLVQSSFTAVDVRQVLLAVARRWPAGSPMVRHLAAQVVDDRSHDAGNYTPRFAELLEQSLASPTERIAVRLVHWSGENHHLGRADAAVRLLDELAELELPAGRRVMLWGHGQAGNVLALVMDLLSADASAIDRFFAAAQIYYRLPATGVIDIPVWRRVQQRLTGHRSRLDRPLDVVTFGTPLRYVWKHRPTDRLLHFINHRPAMGTASHLARLPERIEELLEASGGDYVQQLAVSGTDAAPSRFAWRGWLADRRLSDLLEVRDEHASIADRLACGVRLPETGTTLLVDYGSPEGPVSEHLAGHAVYTRPKWLWFHAEQIAQRLGSQAPSSARAA